MGFALVLLLGVVFGSFANVIIHRVPAGVSISSPRSSCPNCGVQIAARDNVPLISWILLRGKCRSCAVPISIRYPLVEIGLGAVFLFSALTIGFSAALPGILVTDLVGLAAAAIDLESRRIPNRLTLWGGVGVATAVVASSLLTGHVLLLYYSFIGGAIGFGFPFLIAVLSRGGMGMGDAKLSLVLGLSVGILGPKYLFYFFLLTFGFGSLFGVGMMVARRLSRKDSLAFGPFLYAGFLSVQLLWHLLASGRP